METALTGEFPLMCRDAGIERIIAALKGTMPVAFVVAGPAGVGKTRIAHETHRFATAANFDLVQVAGTRAAAAIPFGPFAPLLPAAGSAADRFGLMRQAIDAITGRAGPDRRVLLIVDDAQFLDDGSAALVHQFAHTRSCGLLATVRTPGPAPDPVTALWKDGLAERIDLRNWTEAETGQVPTAVLGEPVAKATVRRLWQLRRERVVAGLAAAGASSREIAARLVLSVRTVANHLQSAYLKLGVSSREDLASMLGTAPSPGN